MLTLFLKSVLHMATPLILEKATDSGRVRFMIVEKKSLIS